MINKLQKLNLCLVGVAMVGMVTWALPAVAERGDDAERKSKNGHVEAEISGVSVVIDYGRPEMRGRDIFGALVPFGEVWRTGADEATNITFSGDVVFGGTPVSAGTYSLFTVPNETEWTVVLNSVAEQWGAYDYSEDNDVVRVTATPSASESTEVMTFEASDSGVELHWDEVAVVISVSAAE